ncbi:serine/threonine protein phosphatase [Rhizobium halophytocola]|uniref:tRNA A-37 threonylcarbamoyl transferase component Bud32 n=1 Tax=Rhizobium halophytocola TaxID=735519 RepID=A0ABS4DZX1_9HYPH|nr:serine/threonine protein phosphatase [Rhizobium halophytocola]MBP1851241.1 tRNA A-37 threonylcarbamoyl transferase component Bud32 [Rhizobium halophytocola]
MTNALKADQPAPLMDFGEDDIATVMRALLDSSRRVERVRLSDRSVWIKRQEAKVLPIWVSFQGAAATLLRMPVMRPSLRLAPAAMQAREVARIRVFAEKGFPVPPLLYTSETAMVLGDVSPTVEARMRQLKKTSPEDHDDLLVQSASALGELHAAGLCHGRPHVRDFFLQDGRIGFFDFEEDPTAVMPLETAQARDIALLFLTVTSRAIRKDETCQAALEAWCARAPAASIVELRRFGRMMGRILPLARLIGRVHMGSDLRRFIMATEFLMHAPETEADGEPPGKAGYDG